MLTLQLSIVLLLILLNGFFAMAEIALVSARPARLQTLAAQGNRGAQAALELKNEPSRLLATVQIGITVIAVLSGTLGEATLGDALQRFLAGQGGVLAEYAHVISMAVVVIAISYLSLIPRGSRRRSPASCAAWPERARRSNGCSAPRRT
jgi:putative hemolysin